MKITLRIVTSVVIFLVAFEVAAYFYRQIYAENDAAEMVQQYCREQNLDLANLSGPTRDSNNSRSYSWIYKDSTHHLELLVVYDDLYDGKVATWDFDRKD